MKNTKENEKSNVHPKPTLPATLIGPGVNIDFGQQLSTYTELKQGKTTRTLNLVDRSPLKGD